MARKFNMVPRDRNWSGTKAEIQVPSVDSPGLKKWSIKAKMSQRFQLEF
jgi:hypothetical protein